MIVCPLCEHAQEPAEACAVCGRLLEGLGGARPAVPRLEGLEPTRLEPQPEVEVERLAELEPTLFEALPPEPGTAGGPSWIEQTVAERVGAVPVEALEVERIDREARQDRGLPAAATCRYCARVAGPSELFCEGCGMKLEVSRPG